ncbi:hypothetical protein GCM10007906_25910 [Vibrio hyugaensis]|uniref:Uncharacterized protein n=1 Tax=Vibrio hyugaensis TaxID=1534743 RepID=A0ABQ5Y3I0_9VIBR|nr:hypothetical protein [Vibrio hyugaensis]GLR05003.1 hypothetical protein GCM10007906_25910 [Vibrio hyugaensis]
MCNENSTEEMRKFIDIADEAYPDMPRTPEEHDMSIEQIRLQVTENIDDNKTNDEED